MKFLGCEILGTAAKTLAPLMIFHAQLRHSLKFVYLNIVICFVLISVIIIFHLSVFVLF